MNNIVGWIAYMLMLPFLLTGWIASWGIIGLIIDLFLIISAFSVAMEIDNGSKFLLLWFSVSSFICLILDLITGGMIWWFETDITWFLLGKIANLLKWVALLVIVAVIIWVIYSVWRERKDQSHHRISSEPIHVSTGTQTYSNPTVPVEKTIRDPFRTPHPEEDDWEAIVRGASQYGKRLKLSDYKNPLILQKEITSTAAFKSCFYKLLYWKRDLDQLPIYGQAALDLVDFALNTSSNIDRSEVRVFLTQTMKRRVDNHRGWDGTYDPEKSIYWPHRAHYLNRAINML